MPRGVQAQWRAWGRDPWCHGSTRGSARLATAGALSGWAGRQRRPEGKAIVAILPRLGGGVGVAFRGNTNAPPPYLGWWWGFLPRAARAQTNHGFVQKQRLDIFGYGRLSLLAPPACGVPLHETPIFTYFGRRCPHGVPPGTRDKSDGNHIAAKAGRVLSLYSAPFLRPRALPCTTREPAWIHALAASTAVTASTPGAPGAHDERAGARMQGRPARSGGRAVAVVERGSRNGREFLLLFGSLAHSTLSRWWWPSSW